jgi:hypothetical protein
MEGTGVNDLSDGAAAGRPMPPPGLETTAMLVETMAATLVMARALVIAGHRIDLDGVEREIADLCAETVALPREDGTRLRPALQHLLREVEALESDLADRLPGGTPS